MTNNTIKNDIKLIFKYASTQSELSYIELLNDFTTISDIASEFDLTTKEVISITNNLEKE